MNLSKILLIITTGIAFLNTTSATYFDDLKAQQLYKIKCCNDMLDAQKEMDDISKAVSILTEGFTDIIGEQIKIVGYNLATYPKTTLATLVTCTIYAILHYKGFFKELQLRCNESSFISMINNLNYQIEILQTHIDDLRRQEPSETINNDIITKQAKLNSLLKTLNKAQAYLAKIQNYLAKKEELQKLKVYLETWPTELNAY